MISRRDFMIIMQLAAASNLVARNFGTSPSSENQPSPAEPSDLLSARLQSLTDTLGTFADALKEQISEMEDAVSKVTGTATVISMGFEAEMSIGSVSFVFAGGVVGSFASETRVIGRGAFFTATKGYNLDPLPSAALGAGFTIGRGSLEGFYGRSSAQSIGARGWEVSASENDQYVGLGIAYLPTALLPTASVSTDSETYGTGTVSTLNVYTGIAQLEVDLKNSSSDPAVDSASW